MTKKWIYAVIAAEQRRYRLRVRHLLIIPALVGLVLLGSAGSVAAHNELIGSDPSDGARVATSPARVSLTFSLPAQRGFSKVIVTGPDGNQWQSGPPIEDGAVVSAPVGPLGPAGDYTIAYQIVSADGHPVRGAVRFTLTTAGTGTAAGTGSAALTPPTTGDRSGIAPAGAALAGSDSTPVWPWLAGVGVLLAAGVVVALRISRARG